MKSMLKLQRKDRKRLSVFLILMLVLSVSLTAQSVTPSTTEKKDSEEDALALREPQGPEMSLTIEEIMEIAEEEIERTSQEAVKAALLEVGGELAFEKERADQLEKQKLALEIENKKLKESCRKKNNNFFYGALIGGTGAVVVTSLLFSFIGGLAK